MMFCTTLLISIVIATHSHPAPLHTTNPLRHILVILMNPSHSYLDTPSRRQTRQDNNAAMAEAELSKSQSGGLEIQQKPYIEEGMDPDSPYFLVFKNTESNEDYEKVIPNDIYYNTEKKSANWLDKSTANRIQNKWLHKWKGLWR